MNEDARNAGAAPQPPREFDTGRIVESFLHLGREILVRPRPFFYQLPRTGDLKNPCVFLVLCSFLASLFMANLHGGDFSFFLLLFAANILSGLIGSVVLHKLLGVFFGVQASFGSTFRIISYAGLTDLVAWVPLVGMIAYVYGLYLVFLGLQEVHQLKRRQAGVAVGAIVLIVTLLLVLALLLAADTLNESMQRFGMEAL
jgi:hypothetical protein